jgi:hypothetical protein
LKALLEEPEAELSFEPPLGAPMLGVLEAEAALESAIFSSHRELEKRRLLPAEFNMGKLQCSTRFLMRYDTQETDTKWGPARSVPDQLATYPKPPPAFLIESHQHH